MTHHAVERFRDRVRPGLDLVAAAEELERLIPLGTVSSAAPRWLADYQRQRPAFYLVIGDVVLPLDPDRQEPERLNALTCLVAGGISATARRRRNEHERGRGLRTPGRAPKQAGPRGRVYL